MFDDSCIDKDFPCFRNAFLSVEKAYIESIDGLVAERTSLQFELPDGISTDKVYNKFLCLITNTCFFVLIIFLFQLSQNYGDIFERLKSIDERLSIGATSVVALIHSGKLYVANVGAYIP